MQTTTTFTAQRFIGKGIDDNGNVRYIREFNPWRVIWTRDPAGATPFLKWVFTSDLALIHPDVKVELIEA
jgi:hypothetical protein